MSNITIMFYSNREEAKVLCYDGDCSHLNKVYVNIVPDEVNTQEKQDDLTGILFDPESGEMLVREITVAEAETLIREFDASLIMCGFIF